MSNNGTNKKFIDYEIDDDDDGYTQHYLLTPEVSSEDTFDVMSNIVAFLRYSELRLRCRMFIFLILSALTVVFCGVGLGFVKRQYVACNIDYNACIVFTIVVSIIGVGVLGFFLERRAATKQICDTMLRIVETEGITVTKQMEDDYRAKASSLIEVGPIKLRIHWGEDYYKACGYTPESN